jgi:protein-S-isoprenylcysteine O-methyltransferase Ste14
MISPVTCLSMTWAAWLLGWLLAARRTAKTVAHQSTASRLAHAGLVWGGAALLFVHLDGFGVLTRSLFPPVLWVAWAGAALAVLGLSFAGWARVHLGRFWSSSVTLKAEHTLIRSGPYCLTRHPIYTGLLLALIGTSLARDSVAALVGLGLLVVGVVVKIRQEERLLTEHFGKAYRTYQAEVPALLPGLW